MPKKTVAGSILTLIGGIITLVVSAVILFAALILFLIPKIYINTGEQIFIESPHLLAAIVLVVFIFVLCVGLFKLYSAKLMRNPKKTLRGGIIALVSGIISTDLLSIIGGIMGIVQGSK